MDKLIYKLKLIFGDSSLRNRILFVIGALALFRVLAAVPTPGVDLFRLESYLSNNQFLGLLNIFSGGGLSNLSIVMLGVAPYITASIIMQLLTVMSEKLKALYHEEGEAGRRKFTQYSRLLTIPLALFQGFGLLFILERQGILEHLTSMDRIVNILVVTAGSLLLMWIGELITEFGVGNGVSLIIFAGIIAGLPTTLSQVLFTFDPSQIPLYIGFLAAAVAIIAGVIVVTEAERPIPITYAKRVRGSKVYGGVSTYLPLRVNQAGVIPIIFALSILLFPQMILNFLSGIESEAVSAVSGFISTILNNGIVYSLLYFILVFLFTYFYTAVTFEPESIATNLQKSGAFIPGVRPGKTTAEHIGRIVGRITLMGATFLGLIAVLPLAMQAVTGLTALAIGGTALLIVVSVVLDLIKKIDAQVSMREY
ncbi:preprotein translocase subunit SecY [bacterium]|nr:preprotein translocase subunit SecY [bacterium]MCI0566090.1 preprotein translocase subunit SecY [bacterium]MCI0679891.1 preprotein translocase subunit SecY [bacterium]